MQKITPFLWFDGKAEEAMNLYVSVFENSKVLSVNRMGPGGPVMSCTFELNGQTFYALNGGPMYQFTPAVSFFVDCATQEEIDDKWAKLIADGGAESRCGWLVDKYGLSWQIIPPALGKYLSDPDPAKSKRVLDAMLKMNKIIIADLEAAYAG